MNVWDYTSRNGTATRRREIRRDVRRTLGTTGDDAPTARRSLRSASELAELVYLATDGKLTLTLTDQTGRRVEFRDAISAADPSN